MSPEAMRGCVGRAASFAHELNHSAWFYFMALKWFEYPLEVGPTTEMIPMQIPNVLLVAGRLATERRS